MKKLKKQEASFWLLLIAVLLCVSMWIFQSYRTAFFKKQVDQLKAQIEQLTGGVAINTAPKSVKKVETPAGSFRNPTFEHDVSRTPENTDNYADTSGFTDLKLLIPNIVVDLKYATTDNFTGKKQYDYTKAVLRDGTAEKLAAVSTAVEKDGYRLKIWDAYRTFDASWALWYAHPDPLFVSNPERGDTHCSGAAVDLTLIDADGNEIEMPSGYDDFTPKAYGQGATEKAMANWNYLRNVMEANGFNGMATEWWHFNDVDSAVYDLVDLDMTKF